MPVGNAEVVATVPASLFRRQIELLQELGEIVPLEDIASGGESTGRLRFALTFDDDEPSHVHHALPILQSCGVPATFFLSGRAAHGLEAYWWQALEEAIAAEGLGTVSADLGIPCETPAELAEKLEGTVTAEEIGERFRTGTRRPRLTCEDARRLADAGMEIGFHTLHHPVLVGLSKSELYRALRVGREDLERVTGRPVRLFAYPHGKANSAVAHLTREAGYRLAFSTAGRPVNAFCDPYSLARWEPGPLDEVGFLAALALRLNLPVAERLR